MTFNCASLAQVNKNVKGDAQYKRDHALARSYVKTRAVVVQEPATSGSDIDHGEFIQELVVIQKRCMKCKATKANESESLRPASGTVMMWQNQMAYTETDNVPGRHKFTSRVVCSVGS